MEQENKKVVKEVKKPVEKKAPESYIMTVGHLSCGRNGRTHFYADKKPLITLKTMGGDKKSLEAWINAGWVEKGTYKK